QIANAYNDAMTQASNDADATGLRQRYEGDHKAYFGSKLNVRDFDGNPNFVSEMDALIAYLQKLGNDVDFNAYNPDMDPRNQGEKGK
ncbi:MAG: hypothetical protein WCL30_06410, partial [Pseudomonadota bacterium]